MPLLLQAKGDVFSRSFYACRCCAMYLGRIKKIKCEFKPKAEVTELSRVLADYQLVKFHTRVNLLVT